MFFSSVCLLKKWALVFAEAGMLCARPKLWRELLNEAGKTSSIMQKCFRRSLRKVTKGEQLLPFGRGLSRKKSGWRAGRENVPIKCLFTSWHFPWQAVDLWAKFQLWTAAPRGNDWQRCQEYWPHSFGYCMLPESYQNKRNGRRGTGWGGGEG